MTLDEARDWFEAQPNVLHAEQYYRIAYEYHQDDMITDATFQRIAEETAELRGE